MDNSDEISESLDRFGVGFVSWNPGKLDLSSVETYETAGKVGISVDR